VTRSNGIYASWMPCAARTPADDPHAEGVMLIDLTNMMLVLPAARQNEVSAEARGEAYLAALDDLPPWALRAAIRRWYRGDAGTDERGDPYDYHWAPAPAELRRIALLELWRVKSRAADLRRLLSAEPLLEYSEEHCHTMRMRLAALMHETFGIPAGRHRRQRRDGRRRLNRGCLLWDAAKAQPGLKREGGRRRRGVVASRRNCGSGHAHPAGRSDGPGSAGMRSPRTWEGPDAKAWGLLAHVLRPSAPTRAAGVRFAPAVCQVCQASILRRS